MFRHEIWPFLAGCTLCTGYRLRRFLIYRIIVVYARQMSFHFIEMSNTDISRTEIPISSKKWFMFTFQHQFAILFAENWTFSELQFAIWSFIQCDMFEREFATLKNKIQVHVDVVPCSYYASICNVDIWTKIKDSFSDRHLFNLCDGKVFLGHTFSLASISRRPMTHTHNMCRVPTHFLHWDICIFYFIGNRIPNRAVNKLN